MYLVYINFWYPPHRYIVSKLTPLQVDFVSYMDDIAGEIGVRPSLPWLFFTDYPLYKRVLWGPVTAYQYRLMGPGKWKGARRAIFTQFDRMFQPLKTRQVWNECSTLSLHVMQNVLYSPTLSEHEVLYKYVYECPNVSRISPPVSSRWRNHRPPSLAAWSS